MHDTTWMNLENIMLWKLPVPKSHNDMIPFLWNFQNWEIHRDRKQISGCQGVVKGELRVTANGTGFHFWSDENVLDSGDDCKTLWLY